MGSQWLVYGWFISWKIRKMEASSILVYVILYVCVSVYTCICVVMILRPSVPTKQKMEEEGEMGRSAERWWDDAIIWWDHEKVQLISRHHSSPVTQAKQFIARTLDWQESCSIFGSFWTTLIFPWQPEVAEREQNPQDPHISSVAKWHKCMSWTLLLPGSWGSPKIHPKVLQWHDDLFFQERTAEQQSTIWVSLKIGYKPSK